METRRTPLAAIAAGVTVTALEGLNVVTDPDVVLATAPIPELKLKAGDTFLRYIYRGEGQADLWAKGRWYSNFDASFITEFDGSGCKSHCEARVDKPGKKSWWFHVRLPDGRTGWTDAFDHLNPNSDLGSI